MYSHGRAGADWHPGESWRPGAPAPGPVFFSGDAQAQARAPAGPALDARLERGVAVVPDARPERAVTVPDVRLGQAVAVTDVRLERAVTAPDVRQAQAVTAPDVPQAQAVAASVGRSASSGETASLAA
jgi:hypothetical protein